MKPVSTKDMIENFVYNRVSDAVFNGDKGHINAPYCRASNYFSNNIPGVSWLISVEMMIKNSH